MGRVRVEEPKGVDQGDRGDTLVRFHTLEIADRGIVLSCVEIPGQDKGVRMGPGLDPADNEADALVPGGLGHVVQVRVEEVEGLAGLRVGEPAPGADADIGIAPVIGDPLRGTGEPEGP